MMSKKMKVLVTGANGLVGSHFVDRVKDFVFLTPELSELDITDKEKISQYFEKHKPDWVVNFAAYTNVGEAEKQNGDESGDVWNINVEGVRNLLEVFGSDKFVQISTDMVFPGDESQPGPYKETDVPPETNEKLTWYGWTKNRGEKLVRDAGGAVLRIIYPISFEFDKKFDYLKGPIKRYAEGKMYPLFKDQQVSITFVNEVAEAVRQIILKDLRGVFHASSDMTTPYELISKAVERLGGDAKEIKTASVIEFLKTQDNKARYPVYGGLDSTQTQLKLGMSFASWEEVVLKMPTKNIGPREYRSLDIVNSVAINPVKYMSKPDGWVMETADFTELSFFLGYKFEPRVNYAMWSPEGVARGGHLESRSKLITILKGSVYYILVDMRPGAEQGKATGFYIGEHEESVGRSVLVPEGVIDAWFPINGDALIHAVGDKSYNKFDNLKTLDLFDSALGLQLPMTAKHHSNEDEDKTLLSLKEFLDSINK